MWSRISRICLYLLAFVMLALLFLLHERWFTHLGWENTLVITGFGAGFFLAPVTVLLLVGLISPGAALPEEERLSSEFYWAFGLVFFCLTTCCLLMYGAIPIRQLSGTVNSSTPQQSCGFYLMSASIALLTSLFVFLPLAVFKTRQGSDRFSIHFCHILALFSFYSITGVLFGLVLFFHTIWSARPDLLSSVVPCPPTRSCTNDGGVLALNEYLYFAFVTITTTGYGDIVPRSDFSKAAIVIGNFFEVLLVTVGFSQFVKLSGK